MENKALYIEKNFNTFKETYVIEKNELDYKCSYEFKNNENVLHSLDNKYLIDEDVFKEFLNEINKIYKKVVDRKIMFEDTTDNDSFIICVPDLNIKIKGKYEINSLISELIDYVKDNFIYLSKQDNGNVLPNNISFKLKTLDDTYNLSLIKVDDKNASLSYVKQSDISKLGIGDVVEYIPIDKYNYFLEQLMQITYNWENTYNDDVDKNTWELSVSTDNYNLFVEGIGGYPNNWNKLIDLIVEYELIFKKSKKR